MDRNPYTQTTKSLASSKLFQTVAEELPVAERIETSYLRAQAIARAYNLTAHDVTTLSDRFWAMHTDNIACIDVAPMALLSIQYNLSAGTMAPYAEKRPELRKILKQVLNFDVSGQFMLTEQAHGLDAIHLETTATMQSDASFILHTPHDGAAKYMPPSVPLPGMGLARVAVVFAKLIISGEDRGVRPFVVALSDKKQMCKGVTSKMLPERAGAGPLGHSITWFNQVPIPSYACLGPLTKPRDMKSAFQAAIWRIGIGSLALGALAVPTVGVSAYILAKYSLRRTVYSADGTQVPIISFRTQQLPIMHALAQHFVMQSFVHGSSMMALFRDFALSYPVRMGISAACKTVMMMHIQDSTTALSDRVGAQGLSCYNQIIAAQLEMRGASIAEGDILVLSIRLATELLLGRYELPAPKYPRSLAARYETGLLAECRNILKNKFGGKHRSQEFNNYMLTKR